MLNLRPTFTKRKKLIALAALLVIGIVVFIILNVTKDNKPTTDDEATAEEINALLEKRSDQTTEEVLEETLKGDNKINKEIADVTQLVFSNNYESAIQEISDINTENYSDLQKFSLLGVEASAYRGLNDTENFIRTVEKILENEAAKENSEIFNLWTANLQNAKNGQLPNNQEAENDQ